MFLKKSLKKSLYQFPDGSSVELASFDRRLIAATIDLILWCIISMPLNFLSYSVKLSEARHQYTMQYGGMATPQLGIFEYIIQQDLLWLYALIQIGQCITLIALHTFCVWKYGGTPGKMITKCQIICETQKQLSLKTAFLRVISYGLSFITFGLGFFTIGFTKKRQGIHDMINKTLVIKL